MDKFIKKFGIVLTFGLLVLLLVGCGSDDNSDDADTTATDADTEETTDDTETVTGASISDQPEDLVSTLSEDGNWIFAATGDITLTEDLVVAGEFYDNNDESLELYRKLGLYTQDDDRNVLDEFTLTVPTIIVESPNFRIQNGTVVGNIEVEAEGFELAGSTIEGDVTFATQELWDSANLEEGTITGETTVAE